MEKHQAQSRVITFRRWTRKSYAVFNSLGKVIRIAVLCLSCSILSQPAAARNNSDSFPLNDSIREHDLDEVVVSAQRSPVLQSQLMRVVQVITRSEIERAPARDLASLLETIRGVDIRKRGTFGMQADISIRGGSFDQTLILINGINITDPQTGHHNLNVPVDIQSIERIEILQGPGARIFGPNAFNGAINIITNEADGNQLKASLSGGQFGFGTAGVTAGIKSGPVHHFLSANGMTSNGFTENTDFKSGNLFYRMVVRAGNSRLDAQAGYNEKAFGANSFYTPRFPNQFEETLTKFGSLQWIPGGGLNIRSAVYWRRHHDRFELFRDNAPEWYATHNYHQSDVAGASLNWAHTGTWGTTSLGLDYRFEHIYSNVLGEVMDQPLAVRSYDDIFFTHSYERSGLSLMMEQSIFRGPFSLSAGMLTYLNTDLSNGPGFFPGIDIGWQLIPALRWYSSFNRTLRLPTFTDLFYSGPGNIGNPLLEPEKAISAETGLKSQWRKIDFDLALFRRWGTNMIDWIKEPGDEQWKSMNLTRVNITGLETGIRIPLGEVGNNVITPTNISLQYSFLHSDKTSGDFASNYVLDHLRHRLNLGFSHPITPRGGAQWNVSWQERDGGFMLYQDGVFSDVQDFKPFWMVDVRLFYNLSKIELFAEASNLLNTQYVTIANVPQPGRWIRVGISGGVDF